jgi:hypothetical protein
VAVEDVDGLRAVNNRLGHPAGDQLLHVRSHRRIQPPSQLFSTCFTGVAFPRTPPDRGRWCGCVES